MAENAFGRRRFVRSAATGVLGIAGGVAATGTGSAELNLTPGEVTVHAANNDWKYQIAINRPLKRKDPVEKGDKAEGNDEINDAGSAAWGEIPEGFEDSYWFSDVITQIYASPDEWDSSLLVEVGAVEHRDYTRIEAKGDRFDYSFSYDGRSPHVSKGPAADDSDTAGDYWADHSASGYVLAGGVDSYRVAGYLSQMTISDPYSGEDVGLEVRFDPD